MWTDKHGILHPFNPTNDDVRDGLVAKDSTDCLASGRIEIVFDSPETLNDARQAALVFAQCADDLRRARNDLESAQENFEAAQMECEKAEQVLKGFFSMTTWIAIAFIGMFVIAYVTDWRA